MAPPIAVASFLVPLFVPALALARPGQGGPLVGFGEQVLEFLTATLGPIVFGIGIAVAGIGLVMGSRDAVQRALFAIAGGAVLFSVQPIIDFVQRAAR